MTGGACNTYGERTEMRTRFGRETWVSDSAWKWADGIKMGCTEVELEEDLSGSELGQGQMAGCCKHDDEPSGCIKW